MDIFKTTRPPTVSIRTVKKPGDLEMIHGAFYRHEADGSIVRVPDKYAPAPTGE